MATAGDNYLKYLDEATQSLAPELSASQAAVQQSADLQSKGIDLRIGAAQNQQSLVQTTYAKLADEFRVEQQSETAQAQETGKERIGGAKVAMAQAGVDPNQAQGGFRAPLTAEENTLQNNVKSISDRYGAKYDTLNAQMNQDLGQLDEEIAGYEAGKYDLMASVATQQSNLITQFQASAVSIADKMLQADTDEEKIQLEIEKLNETIKHNDAMEGIAAQRAAIYAASVQNKAVDTKQWKMDVTKVTSANSADYPGQAVGSVGDVQFKDSHGQPITASTYLHGVLGRQPTLSEVANLLASTGKQDDYQLANYILNGTGKDQGPGTSGAPVWYEELQSKYPYIFNDTFSSYTASSDSSSNDALNYLAAGADTSE